MVTIPATSDPHDRYCVVDAIEASQTLSTILNESFANATPSRDESPIPISRWQIIPREADSEVFYIADPQSGKRLQDTGSSIEFAAISTDGSTSDPKNDSIHLWQLVAFGAVGNLTSVDETDIHFARLAMELLLSQWEDKRIAYTPKKAIATVASIDPHDLQTLKDKGNKMNKSEQKALLDGGVRIDRQGFFQKGKAKDSPYFANLQGQVSKDSVWQVNVQTKEDFGVAVIRKKMEDSMNSNPPKEVWLEK